MWNVVQNQEHQPFQGLQSFLRKIGKTHEKIQSNKKSLKGLKNVCLYLLPQTKVCG